MSGASNMPEISEDADAKDIIIGSGASVTILNNTLTVAGNIENNGSFSATNGTIAFTSGTHNVTGSNTFANLTNSGTVTLTASNNVKGNINNNGTINGTIVMNGDNAQSISGVGTYGTLTTS